MIALKKMSITDYLLMLTTTWRKLLSLSSLKILSLLHKVQDAKLVRVLILDDTVEDKVGKNIEGSCDNLGAIKQKRKIRGLMLVITKL